MLFRSGSNTFIYNSASESAIGAASRDVILDFNAGTATSAVDRISLFSTDLAFLGDQTHAFTASGQAQAHFDDTSKLLQVDSDGNGAADIEIELRNVSIHNLDPTDFVTH